MKVLQYIQVLLLLTILGMILLVQLENPLEVRLPFLFGGRTTISLGWFLLMTLGVGALYTFFLMLPPYLRSLWAARTERLRSVELQKQPMMPVPTPPDLAPVEGTKEA
ncbi:LapA family protein [Deinococcus cellulosilyticus]|uniref:Lipopolysaccharide assembly protein A domain-containing protein n=1 Tax=Deinococcus cellulosilyticus (strain DSM 18568 / NBRC 106333 / KACC 11606 / 5516J-15) TaxID=1223518 RepID=A0A511N6E8_DEIC1|nr:LapA family protein [Deinococcus cellulosilyticus]GEM47981.1 hypothetical protein DC3_36160 [Deinococcus cellulosilyticus NBRC 106333 = KACC 11606]